MAFDPILNIEVAAGAPADTSLFTKVKDNFDNHEARLVNEELDVDLVRAYQIVIDDNANQYAALNIETALAEVMSLANLNQTNNLASFLSQSNRLTSLEGRATVLETAKASHDTRISNAESNITSLSGTTTNHTGRIVSLETAVNTSVADNVSFLSLFCASVDKNAFNNKLVVDAGVLPTYNASGSNETGLGTIQSTVNTQELTYNTAIPVSALMGVGASLIASAPVGSIINFGLKCYTSSMTLISNAYISQNVASNGAFQLSEGHMIKDGVAGSFLPVGTRFVKPFVSWSGNTGTFVLDFMSVFPLNYARYSIFG